MYVIGSLIIINCIVIVVTTPIKDRKTTDKKI
jgi:hypothetical protein